MAKFNIQEFDVVESLKRSISSNVSIFSNIDHYVVTTDQERLKTLILFLLPKNNSNFAKIEINIIPDNNLLEILIINIDPEINTSAESNINNINYEVNKLVAKLLNWDFNIFNLDSQRSARILIK